MKQIIEKLDKCYNVDNDPRSDEYKRKRLEQFQTLTDYEARNLVNIKYYFVFNNCSLLSFFSLNISCFSFLLIKI